MPKSGNAEPAAQGFDALVTVPQGASVQEAIDAAAGLDDAADTRFAAATLSSEVDFEADEVGFPRLRLAQGLTPEVAEGNAKMGQWLFTGFDPFDTITIVPMMVGRSRNKREDPANRDSAIVCSSTDGRVGVGTPGGTCKGCIFAKFTTDEKTGRRRAPACTLAYTYAAWIVEAESFGQITFSRTSEQYAHMLNNLVQFRGFGNFAVQLTSVRKSAPGRMWAEPQIRLVPLTREMQAAAGLVDPPLAITDAVAQPALAAANADA